MTKYDDLTQIEVAAWHEAAHAVVAYHCRTLPRVQAAYVGDHGSGGMNYAEADPATIHSRGIFERMAVLTAGPLCEALLGRKPRGCERDLAKVCAIVGVDAAARMLERRLPESALRRELEVSEGRVAQAFALAELRLRLHWGEVEAVARWMLRAGGAIQGDHLEHVVGTAPIGASPPDGDAERVFLLADQIGDGDPELVAAMHRVLAPYAPAPAPTPRPPKPSIYSRPAPIHPRRPLPRGPMARPFYPGAA